MTAAEAPTLEEAMTGLNGQEMNLPTPGQAQQPDHANEAITAQAVAVKRDYGQVMNQLKALAHAAGEDYVYRIPFKDKKSGRTTYAEGPTIKLANDLARLFGNCQVDIREVDEGDAWIFYARFTDLETGFNITRPFRQRKGQNTGMGDDERRLDSVYQIGASKAIRNVTVNALQTLADFAVREAQSGLKARVENAPDKARSWIRSRLQDLGIEESRVSAVIGRTPENWTVPDLTRLYSEVKSIQDGMANAEDLFPSNRANGGKGKSGQAEQPKGTGQTQPEAEPEPEQPPAQEAPQAAAPEPERSQEPAPEPETEIAGDDAPPMAEPADEEEPAQEPRADGDLPMFGED